MQNPLVSVYIPTRNRKATLVRAIKSVMKQNYENIELVVVDDGSTDGTEEFLLSLDGRRENDSLSIKYIKNNVSAGACVARNQAIEISTGSFITGLDDDDFFESTRIRDFVEASKFLNEYSCLFTGYKYRSNRRGQEFLYTGIASAEEVTVSKILRRNMIGNQIFTERQRLLDINAFDADLPAWQDYDVWIRLIKRFGPAKKINKYSYVVDTVAAPDRISTDANRVTAAHKIFLEKHSEYGSLKLASFLNATYVFYGAKRFSLRDFVVILIDDKKYASEIAKQLVRNIVFR